MEPKFPADRHEHLPRAPYDPDPGPRAYLAFIVMVLLVGAVILITTWL